MNRIKSGLAIIATFAGALAVPVVMAAPASAASASTGFAGVITSTMSVNDGTSTGSIPAGTPYIGTVTADLSQPVTPLAYDGGTRTVYGFSSLTFTIGSSTATSGPGSIDVFDNLKSGVGYPTGDSVYVNFTQGVTNTTGVAPSGPLAGARFNWMGLALLDPSGTAITGGKLASLSAAPFSTIFSEFNFGTLGTPWGAGNTSMIQSLSTVGSPTSTPSPVTYAPTLPDGTVGTAYSAGVDSASGGTGSFTYSATGLPAGLTLNGTAVSGTPTTAGTYPVTLTATDSSGSSASATVQITIAPAAVCSGSNAVETAYVARNPGFIVVNGGMNLLDHLWTTNLNASNTTFLGGLVNWYRTGLILSYTGTADPAGCILDHLTVAPAVTVSTVLPTGTVGVAYQAPVTASWGAAPYRLTVAGLPAGLAFDGAKILGTPTAAGTFPLTITAVDSVGAAASATASLAIVAGSSNYTVADEGSGKITAIDPAGHYLMVGGKKLVWTSATRITVNTPNGVRQVIDSFVKVGMRVQWKGLRDKSTNTVLTSQLEIN